MVDFQMRAGIPEPYIKPPDELVNAELSAVPTHTAVANWGVAPIIQASLF